MQHSNLHPLQHYNELITHLGPWKNYQIRLLLIMVAYWIVSGLTQAIFDLTMARQFLPKLFFVEQSLQIVVILIAVILSVRFPRTKINKMLLILVSLGALIYFLGSLLQNETITIIGQFLAVIFNYTMSLNIMMIMLEYVKANDYPIIWGLSILGLTVGKFIAVSLVTQSLSNKQWFLNVLLPICIFYLITIILIEESPRYWIDQNIGIAEKLLHKISEQNKIKYEPIQNLLQRQFFWHKVTLTKYSLGSLFHYSSISFNAYILGVQALLLGVICRCPDFIQHLRQGTSFQVDDQLQIIWVSIFQTFALIPTYLSSRIFKRKTALICTSSVLLLLTCLLAVLQLGKFYMGNSVIYSMTVFGLNSFFSMTFFYFLILSTIQFFPHSIRTLSCGVIFCLYRLGRLLFSLHIQVIEIPLRRNQGMVELVLCCSVLILIHSFLITETFGQVGRYDLPQIEQKEYDDYLPA